MPCISHSKSTQLAVQIIPGTVVSVQPEYSSLFWEATSKPLMPIIHTVHPLDKFRIPVPDKWVLSHKLLQHEFPLPPWDLPRYHSSGNCWSLASSLHSLFCLLDLLVTTKAKSTAPTLRDWFCFLGVISEPAHSYTGVHIWIVIRPGSITKVVSLAQGPCRNSMWYQRWRNSMWFRSKQA